ncbi:MULTISPECIES: ABC1 kinase family protein [Methylobacillus]|uniref:2-octaprenylphenol hydroxylase n=1 Tax=Methylobacillus flagellatus (strain ATCC 51484 / DSM 6875 / VKM B-1610 / KT) TaxID=265072 RepID=Q1H4C6_METFK|nr:MULTISPECIES: AarF/UbiB family protein [Methylobacillus]ABE48661.1 2-octaprenylphenol hydroxylase [Methylobacillus flagellatus KT]MPS49318.1 ubiquinone biosynthesis protein UbiB [Methylobacillus sp.]
MLRETISVMRDFGRVRAIARILMHYGWGDIAERLGKRSWLRRAGNALNSEASREIMQLPSEVRARLALQELGPTFVKMGQVLATRPDIFPPNWIAEFSKLQDQVPPVPFEDMLPGLQEALGKSPFEVFRDFDTTPVAGASIAQVYQAKLQDGTPVILKVRRPGIRENIDADLRLLHHLARLIEAEVEEARRFNPTEIVDQFSKSLKRELDLALEGRNTERFARNFLNDPNTRFAKIYWEYTSESVLVMEKIDGIPGNSLEEARQAGMNLPLLAARGADAVMKMVLIDGFFHADPHPGNIFFLPENKIAVIDCGMVGRISLDRRNEIADLLAALVSRDIETLRDILIAWAGNVVVDEDKLGADVDEFICTYDNAPLKHISFGTLLNDLTTIMRENHLSVPPDLTMLFKALVTLEGLGRQLDPDFQIVSHLTPFVKKVIIERYMPGTLWRKGARGVGKALGAVGDLPGDVSQVLKEAGRGRLKLNLDLKRLDHFGHQLDHSTNRLAMALITASLIVGSSIVMTVRGGPELFGLPAFGFLGFFLAFVIGIMLMISIWRSGRD